MICIKCASEYCLTPNEKFLSYSLYHGKTKFPFWWNDDDVIDEVHFVLYQRAELDFYSTFSLKQQSEGRHVTQLGYIILIPSKSVSVLLLPIS
jgi:hypothetical protein